MLVRTHTSDRTPPSTAAFARWMFSARSGAGERVVVRPPIVSAAPRPPQKFPPASIGTPQEGHPMANPVPHRVQNRRSAPLSW